MLKKKKKKKIKTPKQLKAFCNYKSNTKIQKHRHTVIEIAIE